MTGLVALLGLHMPEGQPQPVPVRAPARRQMVAHATLTEERDALNVALGQAGMSTRIDDEASLRLAKKTAGLGSTTAPARDFVDFTHRLVTALRLGALGGGDADPGARQDYANAFKAAVIKEVPARRKRLEGEDFTFDHCLQLVAALSEKEIHELTPAALARLAKNKIGHGALAGMFPGETQEATSQQGGKDRLDKMNELGRDIVELLRGAGDVRPELTGSIVLTGGGYSGVPEDLDINVTTQGDAKARKEQWSSIVETMDNYDGATMAVHSGTIRIFPMTPGKVSGENGAIWERRFGYVLKLKGEADSRVMPFEVEVKDVGGDVWKEHLLPDAPGRATDEQGVSKPQWLMLDTMTRILGHRKNMKESVAAPNDDMLEGIEPAKKKAEWLRLVQEEGLDKSIEKRLWEKLNVATTMARSEKSMGRMTLAQWLPKTVKDPGAYLELLTLAEDEGAYERWLKKLG